MAIQMQTMQGFGRPGLAKRLMMRTLAVLGGALFFFVFLLLAVPPC